MEEKYLAPKDAAEILSVKKTTVYDMIKQGRLRAEFTYEGMHIRPEGYRTIYPAIKEILMNA